MSDKNIRPTWTEDMLALCRPEDFYVRIDYSIKISEMLTAEDEDRLAWKLALVEKLAAKLAANMLKGCLKYTDGSDDMTPEQWIAYLADDAADTLNYAFLLKRSLEKGNG